MEKLQKLGYRLLLVAIIYSIQLFICLLSYKFSFTLIDRMFELRRDIIWGITIYYTFVYYKIYTFLLVLFISYLKNRLSILLITFMAFLDFSLLFIYFIVDETIKTTPLLFSTFIGFLTIALLYLLLNRLKPKIAPLLSRLSR